MIDIGTLITLSKEAISGGNKLYRRYKNKKLSPNEKDLLVAASKRGEFHILSVDQIPSHWVRAGGKNFLDGFGDALYIYSFEMMVIEGKLVDAGEMFTFTVLIGRGKSISKVRRDNSTAKGLQPHRSLSPKL